MEYDLFKMYRELGVKAYQSQARINAMHAICGAASVAVAQKPEEQQNAFSCFLINYKNPEIQKILKKY